MNVINQFNLQSPPKGFITTINFNNKNSLFVGSIEGEFKIYKSLVKDLKPFEYKFQDPIINISHFDDDIFILHPTKLTLFKNNEFKLIDKFSLLNDNNNNNNNNILNYQCLKIDQESNLLIIGLSNGNLIMYNLPDLILIDKINLSFKLQSIDLLNSFLIISLSNGSNHIFDLSNKKFINLKIQESGFKYPITTDLKILNINNELPYNLIYAQSGIEGKISVFKIKIELQTDPTVTINTAAKIAPISSSCIINPSGLTVNDENSEKFIFKAHRSKLSNNNILISPIYSLNKIQNYLITSGYTISDKGCICLWDITSKRRIKMIKGLPFNVVKTSVLGNSDNIIVCACCDDIYKNSRIDDQLTDLVKPQDSELVVIQLGGEGREAKKDQSERFFG